MKTSRTVTNQRAEWFLKTRFNPILGLDPSGLSSALDAWDRGELRRAGLIFDKIGRRDSVIATVSAKRYGAIARRDWEIVTTEESPRADKHAAALEYFYRNLTATSAIRRDERGGTGHLFRQMVRASGFGYAAHEIVWQPSRAGLTATLIEVPVHFCEAITGELRYLESETAIAGIPIDPGEWLVTAAGEALMVPSSVEWMFKSLPRKDWLNWCEKFGVPGVFAKTNAQPGSAEWESLNDAVRDFMSDFAAVGNAEFSFVSPSGGSVNPMQDLIDYCDRRLMQLWRGGDVSTQSSADNAVGAQIQQEELEGIEADDIALVNETLNRSLDPWVIAYTYGDDTPLARIEIQTPDHSDAQQERETDKFFFDLGLAQATADLYERHGRRMPDEGEETIGGEAADPEKTDPAQGTTPDPANPEPTAETDTVDDDEIDSAEVMANETADTVTAAVAAATGLLPDLMPEIADLIRDLIDGARSGSVSDDDFQTAAREALLRLPEMAPEGGVTSLARLLSRTVENAVAGEARTAEAPESQILLKNPRSAVLTPKTP